MKQLLIALLLLAPLCTNSLSVPANGTLFVPPTDYSCMSDEERVLRMLDEMCVPTGMHELILAQAKLETGNFESKLFKEHNNAFGMMFPRKRATTALHGKAMAEGRSGYSSYESLEKSVQDYVYFIRHINLCDTLSTVTSFAEELKAKKYYETDVGHYKQNLNLYYGRRNQSISLRN